MTNLDSVISNFLVQILSNPESLEGLASAFNPCHTALDVAQDALDAADNGRMSVKTARKVVNAILDDLENPSHDSKHDRVKRESEVLSSIYWLYQKQRLTYDQMWQLRTNVGKLSDRDLTKLASQLAGYC